MKKREEKSTATVEERKVPEKENADSLDGSSHTDLDINANLCRALPQLQTKYKRKTRNRNFTNAKPNQAQQRKCAYVLR